MSRSSIALTVLLLCGASGLAGLTYGVHAGKQSEIAKRDAQTVQKLHDALDAHSGLIQQSNQASTALRKWLAHLGKKQNQQTQGVTDELQKTKDSRAGCVFPPGVMRELAGARDRAAEAAAGGVRSALPDTATATTPDR